MTRTIGVVLAVVGVGCAAPVEEPPTAGYVLLDREARAAGTLAIGSWHGAPALPISVERGGTAVFRSGDETRAIEAQPQMLAYVRGSSGRIDWIRLGAEARPDALVVEGDAATGAELARTVGGSSEQAGLGRRRITVSDAYFKLAFSKEPEGLTEAFPDLVAGATSQFAKSRAQAQLVDEAARASRRALDFVGLYFHDGKLLVLDASGHYTLDPKCLGEDRPTGLYREDGGRIVLEGAEGTNTLSTEGDDLIDASGRRFALMRAEEPPARAGVPALDEEEP
jgi:hypothetical protein